MKQILLTCSFFLTFASSFAQEAPPTLSFGLDDVLFGKGVIDVELLTNIIAEKQDELKKRVLEQSVLEPIFKETSFATKNYVFSVVHELLNENDKNVLKKEVMEQTVNYAVIYSITEMYVRLSIDSLKSDSLILGISDESMSISALYNTKKAILCANYGEADSVRLNSFLFDCVLHALMENRTFQEKGFLKNDFYFNLDQYNKLSHYKRIKDTSITNPLYRNVKLFVDNIGTWYESFETLRKVFLENEMNKEKGGEDVGTLKKFIEGLDEKLRNARSKINSVNQLEYEINKQEVSKLTDTMEFLLKSKADYEKVAKNLKDRFTNDYPNQIINVDNYKSDSTFISKRQIATTDTLKKMVINLDAIKQDSNYSWIKEYRKMNNFQAFEASMNDSAYAKINKADLNKFKQFYSLKSDSSLLSYAKSKLATFYSVWQKASNNSLNLTEAKEKLNASLALRLDENATNGSEINVILDIIESELTKISSDSILYTNDKYDSLIKMLYESYYFVKYNPSKAEKLDYINWLRKELIPSMAFLNLKSRGKLERCIMLVEYLSYSLEYRIFKEVHEQFDKRKTELSPAFLRIFENTTVSIVESLKFFEKLDQLDKVETYYYLLEQLQIAGEQSGNRDIANAITLITQSIDRYTSYDDRTERINVDVESIILALFERYGERDRNPVNFHMTLGLNNAIAFNNQSLVKGNGDPVRNLGYASEKLGLRFNLYNAKMRYSYLDGETKPFGHKRKNKNTFGENANYRAEPLISNFHAVLYGSGLLYQLTDLGTTKDLKATFVGTGLGLTFYNNLCFNVSAMWPIKYNGDTKFKYAMLNVGFDIYFGEYISALNKKRKQKKEAKLNAEYLIKQQEVTNTQVYKNQKINAR